MRLIKFERKSDCLNDNIEKTLLKLGSGNMRVEHVYYEESPERFKENNINIIPTLIKVDDFGKELWRFSYDTREIESKLLEE